VDNHKGISVKALLDSGAIEMFANKKFIEKNDFKLKKLEKPVKIWNMNETGNNGGLMIYEIEINIYYQGHVERMKLDVCNLERTEVILGMLWLAAHNPEINWETREIKIMRYLALCGKKRELRKKRGEQGEEEVIRWVVDKKEDWGKEKEIEINHRKIERMVPKKFHQWLKVFGKVKSKRIPVRKVWDHIIDLKKNFKARKVRVYSLSKNKREKV